MVFIVLHGWEKNQNKNNTLRLMKITWNSTFSAHKFSFVSTQPLPLTNIYDCFCTIAAELSTWDRDRMAQEAENIYYLDRYRKLGDP